MIGNDVVDLAESRLESNWRRKGWLDKLFCAPEQRLIAGSPDAECMAWLLWSMKEAAYKIWHRGSRQSRFNPRSFECTTAGDTGGMLSGIVRHNNSTYCTHSVCNAAFIHTIACMHNNLSGIAVCMAQSGIPASRLPEGFSIYKDAWGIPYVQHIVSGKIMDASLSHHGRFEAIAVLIN